MAISQSFVEYVTDEKIETLLACHEHAFEYFGGVPKQVLYDNMKTVVIERDDYGEGNHKLKPLLLDFAKHWASFPSFASPIVPAPNRGLRDVVPESRTA